MKKLLTSIVILSSVFILAACNEKTVGEITREKNTRAQQNVMARASSTIPVPRIENFRAREALAEYMRRMDEPGKTWYVYVFPPVGNEPLGYYVSSTYPQSVCTFMTPPEELVEHGKDDSLSSNNGFAVVTAPALDGVYYKGGGCETKFFFDATTDAMVLVNSLGTFTSDAPLQLNTPRIQVKQERKE